ncbi:MAG: NAD-dependent deacylase [Desulfovibrio sp.]|jgi:NAD-dependent deacetylase|nr:NAD-dependent deacylase [Desulfovibrio sp.]
MLLFLTGAGISRESGLATFRGADGLWEKERIEDIATREALRRDPERVYRFYDARRKDLLNPEVAPNPAHYALARLQEEGKEEMVLVTQNIDDLHERAGSEDVLHMHGELLKARCTRCGALSPQKTELSTRNVCPVCAARGALRPHVVLFNEEPVHMEEIFYALSRCRVFIAIGTSGNVYPAAGFVAEARSRGAHTLELNLEPSLSAGLFTEGRYGLASKIVPAFVQDLLTGQVS